jgi:hypothetical protein
MNTIYNFWKKQGNKIDLIFVVVFIVLLFIPMSHISRAEKSKSENRMLAKLPELIVDGAINEKYGPEFNAYFQDRFNGRKRLLKMYSRFQTMFSFDNKKVLTGTDGWLFYKLDSSLDNFQNKTLFSEEELVHIAKYLSDIDNWAKQNGKSFYYFVAPDKNKIYGENIKTLKKLRPDTESRINQLIEYLQKNTSVNVVYLYDVIISKKPQGLLYYKNDTHWNDFGAYFGYQEMMNTIQKQYETIQIVSYDKIERTQRKHGDLTKMLGDSGQEDTTEYLLPVIKNTSVCEYNVSENDETKGVTCTNTNKKLNVFMLRDSFTAALKTYLNNTFNSVKYEWRYNITGDDLKYITDNSDIIILEQVERYVPNLLNYKFPMD